MGSLLILRIICTTIQLYIRPSPIDFVNYGGIVSIFDERFMKSLNRFITHKTQRITIVYSYISLCISLSSYLNLQYLRLVLIIWLFVDIILITSLFWSKEQLLPTICYYLSLIYIIISITFIIQIRCIIIFLTVVACYCRLKEYLSANKQNGQKRTHWLVLS